MGLGAVGAFLPVLPTVPFLLLASFCFGKGSARFHRWYTGTWLYRNHLKDFAEHRTMTLKSKLSILLPVTALLICTTIWVNHPIMTAGMTVLILCKYYYFFFRIKTEKTPKKSNGTSYSENRRT